MINVVWDMSCSTILYSALSRIKSWYIEATFEFAIGMFGREEQEGRIEYLCEVYRVAVLLSAHVTKDSRQRRQRSGREESRQEAE